MSAPLEAAEIPEPHGLSPDDRRAFDAIADLAHREAGLVLPPDKAPMVLARISKRMRSVGHTTLRDYRAFIEADAGSDERNELVYALTTNVTSFFRERHHFDALRDHVLPPLIARAQSGGRVRIWSAGCSSGQEPYSIAMVVLDALPEAARFDVRILATDIDPYMLRQAQAGRFSEQHIQGIPDPYRSRFLDRAAPGTRSAGPETWQMRPPVRELIAFRQLNLLGPWPMKGRFDAIFCRNVVIYFDRETQAQLWVRFADALEPGGHLFLGHSERADTSVAPDFRAVGTTLYQRATPGAPMRKG